MAEVFHPYPVVGATKLILAGLILSIGAFMLKDAIEPIFTNVLIAVWLITVFFILALLVKARAEMITMDDKSITYKAGILSHYSVVLPYSRVTEASYSQSFIHRLFNVGTLRVDSAGGSSVAIYMQELRFTDLERILKQVNERSGKVDDGT